MDSLVSVYRDYILKECPVDIAFLGNLLADTTIQRYEIYPNQTVLAFEDSWYVLVDNQTFAKDVRGSLLLAGYVRTGYFTQDTCWVEVPPGKIEEAREYLRRLGYHGPLEGILRPAK